jgi:two-component system LytT family sensor kinase
MRMKRDLLNTIIRYLFVILYSTAVVILVIFTMPDDVTFTPPIPKWIFVVLYYGIFILNSEVNFYYDLYLNKTMPWFYFPRKRIFIQTGFILGSTLLLIGSFFTTWFILNGGFLVYPPFSVLVFISSVVLLVGFFGISVAINSSREWKTTLLEVKHLEQEKLKSDYKVLQDQLNPHFLFNSLNALIAEIKHDPETAIAFTRGLSQVYRYVLQSKNYELISLRKELDFIRTFIYLHQVRSSNALVVSIDVADAALELYLPPLTLQILVENAIKHNVMDQDNPLQIHISTPKNRTLTVTNNLNPKQSIDSTKTGLSNIRARYAILNKNGMTIENDGHEFKVSVSLLEE